MMRWTVSAEDVLTAYQDAVARAAHKRYIRRQRTRFVGKSLLGGMSFGSFWLVLCFMLTHSLVILLVNLIVQDGTLALLLPVLWMWARRVYPDERQWWSE